MLVFLDWYEVAIAAKVGIQRHIYALKSRNADAFGRGSDDGWTDHIEGAAGELAFAKSIGSYWRPSVNTYGSGGDVGRVQVRTRSKSHYDLIVRENDRDGDLFVLVRGRIPQFEIVGFIRGLDAKKQKYSRSYGCRPAAFFVPADSLIRDFTTIAIVNESRSISEKGIA